MSYWEGPYRWVSTALLVVVGFIAFDTLFRALGANPANVIVGFVSAVAGFFLAPFRDMFADQAYLLTALIALLGYALLAAIIVSVIETVEAARRDRDAIRARRQAAAPSASRARGGDADSQARGAPAPGRGGSTRDPSQEPTQRL